MASSNIYLFIFANLFDLDAENCAPMIQKLSQRNRKLVTKSCLESESPASEAVVFQCQNYKDMCDALGKSGLHAVAKICLHVPYSL